MEEKLSCILTLHQKLKINSKMIKNLNIKRRWYISRKIQMNIFIPLGFQKCPWTGTRRNKHKRLLKLGIWNLDLIKSKRYYKLGEEIIAGGKMTYLMKENHFGFLSHNMGCPSGSDGKKSACNRSGRSPGEGNGNSILLGVPAIGILAIPVFPAQFRGQKSLAGLGPHNICKFQL